MMESLKQLREKFDALTVRERMIVFFGIIGVLYTAWNVVLMKSIHSKQLKSVEQINNWQSQVDGIDNKIAVISANMTGTGQSGAMLRINNLKDEIKKINEIKKDITVGFIRPKQMADILKGILKKEDGLKLIRLQSLNVEPLFPAVNAKNKAGKKQTVAANANNAVAGQELDQLNKKPDIYKHGIILEFQGDYTSTVSYLKSLESLPWKFYWDGMGYEVIEYPQALITINVFTLSLDKGWIGV